MTPDIILYHNNRCGNSRGAKAILEARGLAFREHRYLEAPLSAAALKKLLRQLDLPARALVRDKEALFQEQFKNQQLDDAGWIQVLAAHPSLMQRPVVVVGNKALIARPPEILEAWLDEQLNGLA